MVVGIRIVGNGKIKSVEIQFNLNKYFAAYTVASPNCTRPILHVWLHGTRILYIDVHRRTKHAPYI